MNAGMYSSATPVYGTPRELFNRLDDEFDFAVDVCADEFNRKVDRKSVV